MTKKEEINKLIRSRRTYFDGGLGSLLLARGLKPGVSPEIWNIENPDAILQTHLDYISAGVDFITTNSFGINPLKYGDYRSLVSASLSIAKKAAETANVKIAFDVGPLGRLIAPLGDLQFEEAVCAFRELIGYASSLDIADVIIIETMNDCYETKAAVLGAKEACDLPIFVTNAYDSTNKLMTGASPQAMVAMLEGLGVDALGINCSLGPDLMLPIVEELVKYASVPVLVSPNAGLPAIVDGKTFYNLDSDAFADRMKVIASAGASILGGCCGTTPEYIKKTIEKTKSIPLNEITKKNYTVVSSYTHAVAYGENPIVIGERINPTGKPKLKQALRSGDLSLIIEEAVKQDNAGADVLDVNTGLPEIDEKEAMTSAIYEIQKVTDLPLQIDSSSPEVLESAMRIYNGKPMINSVNGKEESMNSIFPLVKKYGGAVVALTLDENGIPDTAEKRFEIAEKIIKTAERYGIEKKDIIIDPLAMTVSSDNRAGKLALDAVRLLKAHGFNSVMGVSNVSFGLPRRDIVNSSFLISALEAGLSSAILNPFDGRMTEAVYSFRLIHGLDEGCREYIEFASHAEEETAKTMNNEVTLYEAVLKGMSEAAISAAGEEKYKSDPMSAINNDIIGALNEIGARFEAGKAYLPQLLMSAEASQEAINILKGYLPNGEAKGKGDIILATVKGDIHDIGKNIVKVLLESYGFNVIDLGKDVAPETVMQAVKSSGCRLVGLSALMTTTVPAMAETVKLLRGGDAPVKICVGGAVLNEEYASMIGADKFCKDAMDTVKYAQEYYE